MFYVVFDELIGFERHLNSIKLKNFKRRHFCCFYNTNTKNMIYTPQVVLKPINQFLTFLL